MTPSFRRLRLALSSLRLFPHIIILLSSNDRGVLEADLTRWAEALHLQTPRSAGDFAFLFASLMTFTPEFRNLFYLRTGWKGMAFLWMCPRLGSLSIVAPHIGPGLFIQHGENTFVSADRIGANCWIGRHVVVGFSNQTDRPTIGDNVRIFAGAKIIGKIKIGDNSTIGLNTVVVDNVEPNVTLLGVPGKVVWRASSARSLESQG
jgi:serine O-acetyltransferase